MNRLRELFDKPLPFEWESDSSVENVSTATFILPIDDATVADLAINALEDMDHLQPHHSSWSKSRKDPLAVRIATVSVDVEIQNLRVLDQTAGVFEVLFGVHILAYSDDLPAALLSNQDSSDLAYLGYTMAATDLGNATAMFSTVRAVLEDFMSKHSDMVYGLMFSGKGESRQRLYRTFTSSIAKQFGFELVDPESVDIEEIVDVMRAAAEQDDDQDESDWFILLHPDLADL